MICSICKSQVQRATLSGGEFICFDCLHKPTKKAPAVVFNAEGYTKHRVPPKLNIHKL